MSDAINEIQNGLFALADADYRDFHSALMPGVDKAAVIGVRMPALRKYASSIRDTSLAAEFLRALPHRYYDENNLHGLLIGYEKDFSAALSAVDEFLPYVDNWATCDLLSPKSFAKHKDELYSCIPRWISSTHTYTVRFGIGMLMSLYLDDAFTPECPALVAAIDSQEYYVNMMRAWYFATALSKQYGSVIVYLEEGRLDRWTHNKTIQKAVESFRISDETKAYLRTLRLK